MADYDLYYWPIPFRGQFVRAVLAYAGKSWRERDGAAIGKLMDGPPARMPAPFMGPPVLVDKAKSVALSQTPAILLYLGETLGLIPDDPASRALTVKIVADANDVIDDITLDGGRLMWTKPRWRAFQPRLRKWMGLFEETVRRRGSIYLLGETPGVADIVTGTLWSTMGERFPALAAMLDETAPETAALTRRVAALPALVKLAAKARRDYGEAYCGGYIEASLRKVLGM